MINELLTIGPDSLTHNSTDELFKSVFDEFAKDCEQKKLFDLN